MSNGYTQHMDADKVFYRGVLEYEYQPTEYVDNPDYQPASLYASTPGVNTWSPKIMVPVGPEKTRTDIIGPYNNPQPIKAYITRQRDRYKNLRLIRVEKTSGWEEVGI
jgi:hypothetical protein